MSDTCTKPTPINWDNRYAGRVPYLKSSAIRDLLTLINQPGIISLAGGLPAAEAFPVTDIKKAFAEVLETSSTQALQYGTTEGYIPLKEHLCENMRKYGVPAEMGNVIITNGAQQGLDMVGRLFVDEKTVVCTEGPTYLGALQTWTFHGAKYCTVPIDTKGMRTDKLPELFRKHHFKFIYALPNFQNPGGVTMSLERRQELANFAEKYGVFIIEDDPYGNLRYEGTDVVPIVTLAREHTFYLGTVSKTLAPGLRTAWVVAPSAVISKNVLAKQSSDLFTSVLLQMVVHKVLTSGMMKEHVAKVRTLYKERRDAMLSALEKHFPEEVKWTRPEGGLFLWITTPKKINTTEIFDIALAQGVAYVPGVAFYPNPVEDGLHTMRLNFSYNNPEKNAEGIKRLGIALKQALTS